MNDTTDAAVTLDSLHLYPVKSCAGIGVQEALLIETGVEYTELRGIMVESEAVIHRDTDVVAGFGKDLTVRYSEGIESIEGDAAAALEAQAAKRVAISFPPTRVRSWDHRKLGGTY